MQSPFQNVLVTTEATVFTEALAPGAASAVYDIPMGNFVPRAVNFFGVTFIAKEQFAAELDIFARHAGPTNDPQTDSWLGYWGFSESMFQQLPGSTLWRATIYGVNIPYEDLDTINTTTLPSFHVMLVNRSVANSKSAGAAGYVSAKFFLSPIGATNL